VIRLTHLLSCLAFVFSGGLASAQSPPIAADSVRLPILSLPAPPPVVPVPTTATMKLTKELLYVFDADVQVMVITSPPGILAATREDGPVKIKGRFVENPTKLDVKTFKGKSVWTVEPISEGVAELIVIPVGATDQSAVKRQMIDTNTGPQPPPKPVDPVDPPKPPPTPTPTDPSPFVGVTGLHVLMTFDATNTTRPATQNSVLYGKKVREWLNTHCTSDPSGQGDGKAWRIYSDGSDVTTAPAAFMNVFAKRGGKDWIMIGDGKEGYSGPLPLTEAEAMALLEKYGGK
jgi:hypothetical protein